MTSRQEAWRHNEYIFVLCMSDLLYKSYIHNTKIYSWEGPPKNIYWATNVNLTHLPARQVNYHFFFFCIKTACNPASDFCWCLLLVYISLTPMCIYTDCMIFLFVLWERRNLRRERTFFQPESIHIHFADGLQPPFPILALPGVAKTSKKKLELLY